MIKIIPLCLAFCSAGQVTMNNFPTVLDAHWLQAGGHE